MFDDPKKIALMALKLSFLGFELVELDIHLDSVLTKFTPNFVAAVASLFDAKH